MADKIDQLKIGNTSYDIDLPPDAEPTIAGLTVDNGNMSQIYVNSHNGLSSLTLSTDGISPDNGSNQLDIWVTAGLKFEQAKTDSSGTHVYTWTFPEKGGVIALTDDIAITNSAISMTGAGNAITSLSITNGQIVANKGTTFPTANYYHTTGTWNGLTYTATANGGAGALALTIPTGTTSTTVAVGNHSHGNITNTGTITSTAVTSATGVLVYDSNNKIQRATAANARSIIGAGTGTVSSVRVQAGTGLSSSTSTAQTSTLDTTISIASDYKLPTTTEWGNLVTLDSAQTITAAKTFALNGVGPAYDTVVVGFTSTAGGSLGTEKITLKPVGMTLTNSGGNVTITGNNLSYKSSSNNKSDTYNFRTPTGATGVIAVTSDIPDVSGKANLSGGNTFSGSQSFSVGSSDGIPVLYVKNSTANRSAITFYPNCVSIYDYSSNGRTDYYAGYIRTWNTGQTTSYNLSFPSQKAGTIALTSDLPIIADLTTI